MAVTLATEDGYRPIQGADHHHSTWHYKLTPGIAYRVDAAEVIEVPVTPEQAARATPTYYLRFVGGRTVAEFSLDGETYCQPLPAIEDAAAKMRQPAAKVREAPRAPKPKEAPRKEAPRKKIGYESL